MGAVELVEPAHPPLELSRAPPLAAIHRLAPPVTTPGGPHRGMYPGAAALGPGSGKPSRGRHNGAVASTSASVDAYKTLDFALRVGELLLASGAGAADVTATMTELTRHLGLRGVDIDVTFTSLRMTYQVEVDAAPLVAQRTVAHRVIDYTDLTSVHLLTLDVLAGRTSRDEARRRMAQISSSGHRTSRRWVVLGSGLIGAGVAMILGAGPLVVVIAAVAASGVQVITGSMQRRRWPMFYQQAAGGLFASTLGVLTALLDWDLSVSQVITASIVMLLSGIGFMGAIQDALSGFYLTASARLMEALMATAGLIAGVAGGLALAPVLSIPLGSVDTGLPSFARLPLTLVGAILAAGAFAFVSYAPRRAVPAVAATTLAGHLVYSTVLLADLEKTWAAMLGAVTIGVVSFAIAGRVGIPPLVVVVPALVPMLPGLAIYRGLTLMADGHTRGILALVTAASTTVALAAGVILGEYAAQPLNRNARRLESRLAGPRLVGVPHGARRSRPRRPVRPVRDRKVPRDRVGDTVVEGAGAAGAAGAEATAVERASLAEPRATASRRPPARLPAPPRVGGRSR